LESLLSLSSLASELVRPVSHARRVFPSLGARAAAPDALEAPPFAGAAEAGPHDQVDAQEGDAQTGGQDAPEEEPEREARDLGMDQRPERQIGEPQAEDATGATEGQGEGARAGLGRRRGIGGRLGLTGLLLPPAADVDDLREAGLFTAHCERLSIQGLSSMIAPTLCAR